MGIPSYFSYVIRNYNGIISPMVNIIPHTFTHLFMDCNSIIYDSVHSLEAEKSTPISHDEIINTVIKKIKYYINFVSPSDTVYIAFDGVAPLAKMEQQRSRRLRNKFLTKLQYPDESQNKWDTNQITPGTDFMKNLSRRIIDEFQQTTAVQYDIKHLVVSASNERGEGEHKIFRYIREHPCVNSNILIYGLDSDLLMLSILNKREEMSMSVFREMPEMECSMQGKVVDKSEFHIINIKKLINGIMEKMVFSSKSRMKDYVLLCFFLGNDFLPHLPGFNIRSNGMETMLEIYKKNFISRPNKYLVTEDKGIEWKEMKKIIEEMSKREENSLIEEGKIRKIMRRKTRKNVTINELPMLYGIEDEYINVGTEGWEERYYKVFFEGKKKEEVAKNYIKMIEWVYKYYIGEEVNERERYEYCKGPLMKDILLWINNNKKLQNHTYDMSSDCSGRGKTESERLFVLPHMLGQSSTTSHAISEEEQLKYIMPREEIEIERIEMGYKKYIWECEIIEK